MEVVLFTWFTAQRIKNVVRACAADVRNATLSTGDSAHIPGQDRTTLSRRDGYETGDVVLSITVMYVRAVSCLDAWMIHSVINFSLWLPFRRVNMSVYVITTSIFKAFRTVLLCNSARKLVRLFWRMRVWFRSVWMSMIYRRGRDAIQW